MEIWDRDVLAEKREKYPDILLAELLDTSEEFREWLVGQTAIPTTVDLHLGVRCNESHGGRETDVMFGFEGDDGDHHLVLIENKIKAQEQPSQLAEYHTRGESYVDRGHADAYTVCLLAPENWLTSRYERKVDSVVFYEDVIDVLTEIDHDGAPFIRTIFEECAEGAASPVPDFSSVTEELWSRIRIRSDEDLGPRPGRDPISRKHVRCVSNDPEHPNFIVYNIYLAKPDEYGHTNIRFQIDFTRTSFLDAMDVDPSTLQSRFGAAIDRLLAQEHPDFREEYENIRSQNKTVMIKKVKHDEFSGFGNEDYLEAVVDEFCTLIDKVHPIIVSLDFEELASRSV